MKRKNIFRFITSPISDVCVVWADEMKITFKDVGVLLFFIVVPIAYPLLYSWLYNNETVHEVPTVVVDRSHSKMSRDFIRMFDSSPNTKVAYYCNSVEEAQELVGTQKAYGVLYFPHDFDKNISRGEHGRVSVYCNMSLMLTYKAIYQTAMEIASDMNTEIQKELSPTDFTPRDEEVTTQPLAFDEIALFNETGGYGNSILPGVLMVIIQQTLLLGIGLSAGTTRERNRYNDLVPISKHYQGEFRIVIGKGLCYFMIYAIISAYLAIVVPRLFHFTAMADGHTLVGLILPYVLACIFFGITISCLVRYRENVMLLVVFTSVIFLFMTGISWPETCIPSYWKSISWIFPSTFGVKGFLKVSSMGGTLNDIHDECAALWAQALVYFITACLVYRVQVKRATSHTIE